jgi:hypothetical protein
LLLRKSRVVVGGFGSKIRFEPEPDRTERAFRFKVQQIAEPEPQVRFSVRRPEDFAERVRTHPIFSADNNVQNETIQGKAPSKKTIG